MAHAVLRFLLLVARVCDECGLWCWKLHFVIPRKHTAPSFSFSFFSTTASASSASLACTTMPAQPDASSSKKGAGSKKQPGSNDKGSSSSSSTSKITSNNSKGKATNSAGKTGSSSGGRNGASTNSKQPVFDVPPAFWELDGYRQVRLCVCAIMCVCVYMCVYVCMCMCVCLSPFPLPLCHPSSKRCFFLPFLYRLDILCQTHTHTHTHTHKRWPSDSTHWRLSWSSPSA